MNIVIEGIDGSGKTSLAIHLAWRFGMNIQRSEGPPHFDGEMDGRIRGYLRMDNTIFDRHPVISQPIYNALREKKEVIDPALRQQFYLSRPLIIYCEPTLDFTSHHIPNDFDTPEHLDGLGKKYHELLAHYHQWAVNHANLVYRVPEPYRNIAFLVASLLGHRSDFFGDIALFHEKFGMTYTGPPRQLPEDMRDFREQFLSEELHEYRDATSLEDKLDALVDLVYIAIGNAYQHGFPFDEAWRRVHEANMLKVRVARPSDSMRGSAYDVIKPPGWRSPCLSDLCES